MIAESVCRYLVAGLVLSSVISAGPDDDESDSQRPSPVQTLHTEARALRPLTQSDAARAMLDATEDLPNITPRVVYYKRSTRNAISEANWQALDEHEQAAFERSELGEQFYYHTRYGTPLAYVRAFDIVAAHMAGSFDGKRIFDFGYGTIGHLRLLASVGAHVVGVDVDSLLREVYAFQGDTGRIERASSAGEGSPGSITLHHGFFPADSELTAAIGGGYDLVVSKNTLKKGYIHPEREVDPRMLVHLGVDDDTYIRALHDMLNPGGYVMIYNLYPAPAAEDEPYKPWADGRSPFTRDQFKAAGFEIVAYNKNDTAAARQMAIALGWEEQMSLDTDLFAMYTLLRKR